MRSWQSLSFRQSCHILPEGYRIAAALTGANGNRPETLAQLARNERAVEPLRYIAHCGAKYEPENPFWRELVELLPEGKLLDVGPMPHPTKFIEMTGMIRGKIGLITRWIRSTPSSPR